MQIDAGLGARDQRFGDQRGVPNGQEVIDQLGLVAGAGAADMEDVLGESLERGLALR